MRKITLSDLSLNTLRDITGNITSIGLNTTINDVDLFFDKPSLNKLCNILRGKVTTRNNQKLMIETLTAQQEGEKTLTVGLSSKNISSHFVGDLYGFVETKESHEIVCIVMKSVHFSLDFSYPPTRY